MNSPDSDVIYEFGGFLLDAAQRSLLRTTGETVTVGPKAFDALVYLVEHAGQVVERGDLAAALWPRAVVEDNNLSQTILALRRALGDAESGQRFVVTVPRRGYQFVAEVTRRPRTRPPLRIYRPSQPTRSIDGHSGGLWDCLSVRYSWPS